MENVNKKRGGNPGRRTTIEVVNPRADYPYREEEESVNYIRNNNKKMSTKIKNGPEQSLIKDVSTSYQRRINIV